MAAYMYKLIPFPIFNLSGVVCVDISSTLSVHTNKQMKSNHVLINLRKLKGL